MSYTYNIGEYRVKAKLYSDSLIAHPPSARNYSPHPTVPFQLYRMLHPRITALLTTAALRRHSTAEACTLGDVLHLSELAQVRRLTNSSPGLGSELAKRSP